MSRLSISNRLAVPDDTLFRNIEGESVLVGLKSGIYYGLDPVGTRIWELVVEHGTLATVLSEMVAEYEVKEERARTDLLQLVEELVDRGLLTVAAD